MAELKLERAKERIAHPYTEDELMPLLLFRGRLNMGQTQALYKTALLMMDAEIPSRARIKEVTSQSRDLLHMTGLHDPAKGGIDIRSILNRIVQCPTVLDLNPRLKDYAYWVAENSGGAWRFFYKLDPIPRWSIHAKAKFRYPYKKDGHRGGLKSSKPKEKDSGILIPQFYPFYTETPDEEHDLLEWAHHLVPRSIPDNWRADICQDLIVALLMGEVTKDNAELAVPKYIKKVFKEFPSKYGPLSLDAEFSPNDDRTLMDKLAGDSLR